MVVHFVNCLGEVHNANEKLFLDLSTDQVLEENPLKKPRQAGKFCVTGGLLG